MLQLATLRHASPASYVRVPVYGDTDPTDDAVSLAFIDADTDVDPGDDDWIDGTWDPNALTSPWKARALIGTAGSAHPLDIGHYRVWVRFVDNPETPVAPAGYLVVE